MKLNENSYKKYAETYITGRTTPSNHNATSGLFFQLFRRHTSWTENATHKIVLEDTLLFPFLYSVASHFLQPDFSGPIQVDNY